jgi:hypothetical protein
MTGQRIWLALKQAGLSFTVVDLSIVSEIAEAARLTCTECGIVSRNEFQLGKIDPNFFNGLISSAMSPSSG